MKPVLVSAVLLFPALSACADEIKHSFFRESVRPILQRCVGCHGGDEPAGTLDLTTRAGALKGGETGPALKPGNAKDSLIFGMASSKAMPPKNPLAPEQIALLRKWIDDGAAWEGVIERKKKPVADAKRAGPDWWSLQPLRRSPIPRRASVANPIDAFIGAALEAKGMTLSPRADRVTLLRRVTFDLVGLPPAPAEIDAFVKDDSPDAYVKVVERLLASPHHGERWGRHWLDVARFGESQGFERDKPRDHAWRYRDWVIRSFNEDKPYTRFIKEQLAGDVLEPVTPESIVATGFLVCGPWDEVGATQQGALMRKRAREEELEDMVSVTAQTFLGLTINCARCHNHKFDPIPQKDYYRLKAALEGVHHGDRALLTPGQVGQREESARKLQAEIDRLMREVAAIEREGREKVKPSQKREADLPRPLARWSFEGDTRDAIGDLHGTLVGRATIQNGRLRLDGKTGLVRTAPLPRPLKAKTLEAWTSLATLKQSGGGVITVQSQDGGVFDSIVYGERQPGKWIAGSNGFVRTRDLTTPQETAAVNELVHVASVYHEDGRISVYRNGQSHGETYTPAGSTGPQIYAATRSHVQFGLRHTGAGNGWFAGEIEEARLYDRALSSAEVASSFRAGVDRVPLEQILAALTPEQRKRREELLATLSRKRPAKLETGAAPLAYAANIRTPEPTFLLLRGDIEKQGERVSAGGLSTIKAPAPEWDLAVDAPEGQRRLRLAEWVASPDNPLTARVMVNRVWHYHFGRGLIGTPNDFGFNGGLPSHPELLDWLAAEFIRSGWSVKHLHRLIVLSDVYQQSSRFDAKAAALDADSRLLWRFPSRRLEGEAVRDAMLAVSGELNPALGGPSFRPFVIKVFNSTFYTLTDPENPEFQRRTVYRMNVGSAKSPLLEAFDCPDPSVKMPQRGATTTPLQALGLMNGSFVLRQAHRFAERVKRDAGEEAKARVVTAYRLAFGRLPAAKEMEPSLELLREHGLDSLCWVLLNTSEFLYLK